MAIDQALRDELIEQARRVAEERGWTWREPVDVTEGAHDGEPVWIVRTNVLMRGVNVRVVVRRSDRAVVHAGYLPR
ncbi:MAG TPA: hypothetical protein VKE96_27250 [Vicinamibacterales bacterium]|nr:hypothetical protein [Vicinamibacterales bacterium]